MSKSPSSWEDGEEIIHDYDRTIRNFDRYGGSIVLSSHLLGKGSYGKVFLASDEHTAKLAVKCCSLSKLGVVNLMEASIMRSIIHPHLNRAVRVCVSEEKLYLLTDVAQTDLAVHTRKEKRGYIADEETLSVWTFSLVAALDCLHREKIIHGDVKASNVLLYSDGHLRLTDFTLSVKKWRGDELFLHNVCTCTHRPWECLFSKGWNELLDVWSLGCTLYEIAYGELLFPYQGVLDSCKNKESKSLLRQRCVNALLDWAERKPSPEKLTENPFPLNFIRFRLSPLFFSQRYRNFNRFLLPLLTVDAKYRPSIKELLKDSYLGSREIPTYLTLRRPLRVWRKEERSMMESILREWNVGSEEVENLASAIYLSLSSSKDSSDDKNRIIASLWIAHKLVLRNSPSIIISPSLIGKEERRCCSDLDYHFSTIELKRF